jgi:hypothetical protein
VKKAIIKTVVIVIQSAEFVKDKSNPNTLISTIGCTSNCFRGLSPLAMG